VVDKGIEKALSEFICAVFLENRKPGDRIQRLKNVECEEPGDWLQPSVSSAMECMSSEFIYAEGNVEEDVGVAWSEPSFEGKSSLDCWIDTREVGIHCTGNSTKRESPCDCMLAAS
jgi:hypothetical protein